MRRMLVTAGPSYIAKHCISGLRTSGYSIRTTLRDLNRSKVYILNVLKCRPPKNRDPLPNEIEECEPHLITQLKLKKPKLIVALGRISAMTLLKTKDSLTNMRGKIHKYDGIDQIATYHPAALLRNPNFKKPTWEDFKLIRDKYING